MKWLTADIRDFKEEEYTQCLSLMTEERRKYINSLSDEKRKLTSVCAQWHILSLASEVSGKKYSEITVLRNEKGKPYLKDLPFHISISHSDSLVAVAINQNPIGIDIEKIKSRNLNLCRKLCDDEASIIRNSNNPTIDFYKIWTAKEAYFKMTGTGIVNLKSVSYKDIDCTHFFKNDYIITIVK
ncbi:MAG: 4'-phosphopantetheinyl transferase superfamily protein [Acutalibacteraceae bacterium]|nr:4'-phosphopantetheinyl transferase superfamily protein [Acutalibacteraceae bacterium]